HLLPRGHRGDVLKVVPPSPKHEVVEMTAEPEAGDERGGRGAESDGQRCGGGDGMPSASWEEEREQPGNSGDGDLIAEERPDGRRCSGEEGPRKAVRRFA